MLTIVGSKEFPGLGRKERGSVEGKTQRYKEERPITQGTRR